MIYHEVRRVKDKEHHYLIHNTRDKNTGKWAKKSKYIGNKTLQDKKIEELKKEFDIELKTNKKYTYLTKKQVQDIEHIKHTYRENIEKLDTEEKQIFQKTFFTELTYNSNAIEGNTLSLEETDLILNENIVPEGKTVREIYEAKNHKRALDVVRNYKGQFNETFLLNMHKTILQDISQNFAGRYRESNVKIFGSNVTFPKAAYVPQKVKNLFFWYNKHKKELHPFELAIIFSMKLVTIHPFVDGNGRVSRIMMNVLLQKAGYPWINVYNKHRSQYLKAVRKANDKEYKQIIEFLLKNLKENLKDFDIM